MPGARTSVSHHSRTLSDSAAQVLFHRAQEDSEVGKLAYIGQERDLTDLRDAPYLSVCVACPGFCEGSVEEAGLRQGKGHTWAVTKEGQSGVGRLQAW